MGRFKGIVRWDPDSKKSCKRINAMIGHGVSIIRKCSETGDDADAQLKVVKWCLWPFLTNMASSMKLTWPVLKRGSDGLCELKFSSALPNGYNKDNPSQLENPDDYILTSFLETNISIEKPVQEWKEPLLLQYFALIEKKGNTINLTEYIGEVLRKDDICILEPKVSLLVEEIQGSRDDQEEFRQERQRIVGLMLTPFVCRAYEWYVFRTREYNHLHLFNNGVTRADRADYTAAIVDKWLQQYILLTRKEWREAWAKNGKKRTMAVHAYEFSRTSGTLSSREMSYSGAVIKSLYSKNPISKGVNVTFKRLEELIQDSFSFTPKKGAEDALLREELKDLKDARFREDEKSLSGSNEHLSRLAENSVARDAYGRFVQETSALCSNDAESLLLVHLWLQFIGLENLRYCYEGDNPLDIQDEDLRKNLGVKEGKSSREVKKWFFEVLRGRLSKKKKGVIAREIAERYIAGWPGVDKSYLDAFVILASGTMGEELLFGEKSEEWIAGANLTTYVREKIGKTMNSETCMKAKDDLISSLLDAIDLETDSMH